ncbi:MAG: isoprenylcysteine carboxylmethyltransferase family protein [Candidatus Heimdallarchaeota archaeon]|nr:isoprenylcysteine carboxylmethyltransferase family protein [Candidatus Heimdallarchaeota archaeon]
MNFNLNLVKKVQKRNFRLLELVNVTIMSFAYIALFFSGFLRPDQPYNYFIGSFGWIIWFLGLMLALSPNFVLKQRGEVPEGKSYIHTTKLVKDGIYGVMRHPQYTGGIVIAFAMCLIIQAILTYFLAVIALITAYLSMVFEEERLLIKFGLDYESYKAKVPRANFLIGFLRKVKNLR